MSGAGHPTLSVVVPCYNEREGVAEVCPALQQALAGINYEVLLVDDGSTDGTFAEIEQICAHEPNVRGLAFSRNFGKESAIWAGLAEARGDCVAVMDSDLQHPPEVLPQMYALWEQGYEIVEGVKSSRGEEGFVHRRFADSFYKTMSWLSGFDMSRSSDFKLIDRKVLDELLRMNEYNTFFRGLSFWLGFNSTRIEFEVAPRQQGKAKWNFISLFRYAINNITSFSTAPLQVVSITGIALLIVLAVFSVQTLARYLFGYALEGFTTIILLLLLIGGGLMVSLGIIGLYIAKIYDEVKGRPKYVVSARTPVGHDRS